MSTKYNAGGSDGRILQSGRGRIGLTDHAIHRWRERTPHDCRVQVAEAFRKGEWIRHPDVCRSPNDTRTPAGVRVYKHHHDTGAEWGVAFLIVEDADESVSGPDRAELVVATIIDFAEFDHGPTRSYLHGHGPHGGDA